MIFDNKPRPLIEVAASSIVENIHGIDPSQPPEVEEARKRCRAGDPFPLIGLIWPEFVVSGEECRFFEGEEGNIWNPCLRFDWWQRLIFASFFDVEYPEVFIKGCTGPGKGACVAVAINLDYDVHDPCMWYVTADTNSHAHHVMFGEVLKWRNKMMYQRGGRTLATTIVDHERRFITVLNPEKSSNNKGEAFSGRHGAKYCFDESSSVPDIFYENACKNATKIVCLSNPRTKVGFFRSGFNSLEDVNKTGVTIGNLGKRLCVTVGGLDCANVRENRLKDPRSPIDGITIDGVEYPEGDRLPDEVFEKHKSLIPGQMDLNQYRSIVKNSNEKWKIQCFAYGWFPDEDPISQFIMLSWLEIHHKFFEECQHAIEVEAFGLDVARSVDGDDTCLAAGGILGCKKIFKFKEPTYPQIAERVVSIARNEFGIDLFEGHVPVAIDYGGGYGAGPGDWLAREGVCVIEHQPGSRAQVVPEVYNGQRAEDWALLAERLDPTKDWKDTPWGLPRDSMMIEEMLAMTKVWDNKMERFSALPKEQMKMAFNDRRSPDTSDSVMLLWRAVRALNDLDAYLRSAVLGREAVLSYAGKIDDKVEHQRKSVNARQVIEDLASYYKTRTRPSSVFDDEDDQ